jgi:putative colanic acid biosynthesis UDP-glucose lipid carrier transferase
MISDRNKGIQRLVLLCECILVTVAFWADFALCWSLPVDRKVLTRYSVYNEFMLLGLLLISWRSPASVGTRRPAFEETSRLTVRQLGGALFFLLLYLVAAQDDRISRLFLFSLVPWLYMVLFVANHSLPPLLGRLTFHKGLEQKVLLVGPRHKAAEVKRWLDQNQYLGLRVLGLLTEDGTGGEDESLPTLGRPENLEKVLGAPGLMQVIMVEFPRGNSSMKRYTDLCEGRGIRLLVVADLDEIFGHPLAVFKDQGMFFMGLREEPLEDPVNRFFKRCMDIAVSLPVVLFILPPLTVLTWIFQRLQSPGPIFFIQTREGIQKRPFRVFKFRSMHTTDPANENRPASETDPRLYPYGTFMRKTSLDEMPQFLNVLRGEMSVVGPRPHLQSYAENYHRVCSRAYVRNFVKPGVTGIAQVNEARGCPETPELVTWRIKCDIEYLENWSLSQDAWLIIRTAAQVVFPPKIPAVRTAPQGISTPKTLT